MITKTTEIATSLIQNTVTALHAEDIINENEKRFLRLPFDESQLSLTNNQDEVHQLRFYEADFGRLTTNQIAIKLAQYLNHYQEITSLNFSLAKLSDLERLFVERLNALCDSTTAISISLDQTVVISPVVTSYQEMRNSQNIGDMVTARIVGDRLLDEDQYANDPEFLREFSFCYFGQEDPLATEALMNRIISMPVKTAEQNRNLVGALYILGLLYSRHLPVKFRDLKKSADYLEQAYQLTLDESVPMKDRLFERVFNRNGYALITFYDGKFAETIELMKKLIAEIEPIISENPFAKLHLAVLNYNLFQVYQAADMNTEAEAQMQHLFTIDPLDVEYKYDYVRFLINQERFDDALTVLDEVAQTNRGDLVFQASYYAQCYMNKGMYDKAIAYAKSALVNNGDPKVANRFLYNYIAYISQLNETISPEFLERYLQPGYDFEHEVRDLFVD